MGSDEEIVDYDQDKPRSMILGLEEEEREIMEEDASMHESLCLEYEKEEKLVSCFVLLGDKQPALLQQLGPELY